MRRLPTGEASERGIPGPVPIEVLVSGQAQLKETMVEHWGLLRFLVDAGMEDRAVEDSP